MARASDPIKARAGAIWIVRRLRDHGHTAYFAGGCVRDALLGQHPTDYDVATDAVPQRVRELFPRTAEVGAAFGVVLVRVPGEHCSPGASSAPSSHQRGPGGGVTVEVATFRSDGPYSDARRPDSVHFSDPKSDAERRDFTINALFVDPITPDGADKVIDFVGGIDDLNKRVLRAVGDPDKRLAEDHLRALRAVRFAARLGFAIDPATAAAITRHASELKGVSRERIGEELRRMLAHPSRPEALALLEGLALDTPVLTEPHRSGQLPITRTLSGSVRVSTALAAWLTDRAGAILPRDQVPEWVRRWRKALCLSNEEAADLADILDELAALESEWVGAGVALRKRIANKRSFSPAQQLLRAIQPDRALKIEQDVIQLQKDGVGLGPDPFITGDDLVASGMAPGPRFKRVLDLVYDAQLEGRIRTKPEAMELAGKVGV